MISLVYPDASFQTTKRTMLLITRLLLRRLPLILACVCAFTPAAARAQAQVEPGARIRVLTSTADTMMYGTLVTLDSASLLLAPRPDAEAVRVPLAGVERLEVSRGGKPSTLQGAAVGAVVGAGAGLGIGLLATQGDCDFVCGAVQVGSSVIGGVIGLIMGALTGSEIPHGPERWQPVRVRRD
jgi:hypothetical protein